MIARIGSTSGWSDNFTVGASAVEPNRLVYLAAGVVQHARGNAAATARGIAGVTLGPAVSSALALVQRTELVRVKVDAATPASGLRFKPLYLSAEEGGLATSVITGQTYPRLVGQAFENDVASDGTVLAQLSLDDVRDDATEWLLETWAPTENSSTHDFLVTPSFFEELRIVGSDLRVSPASNATSYYTRIDGAVAPDSHYGGVTAVVVTHDNGGAKMKLSNSHASHTHERLDCRLLMNADLMTVLTVGAWMDTPYEAHTYYTVPTTSIGVEAHDAFNNVTTEGFQANLSTLKLYGRVL